MQHLPGAPAAVPGLFQLVAPLAQAQIEGQGEDGEIDPGRGNRAHDSRSVEHPEDKPQHQQDDIQKGDVLQPQAVAQVGGEVGRHQQKAPPPVAESGQLDSQGGGQQSHRQDPGRRDRHRPGGDRPVPLDLVLAVGLHIPDVVDHIHRRGEQAEGGKPQHDLPQHGGVEQVPVEGDGDKDEKILNIVLRPHELDQLQRAKVFFHVSSPPPQAR